MEASSTTTNDTNKAEKSTMLLRYFFGDNNFKDTTCSKSCWSQVLHSDLVIEVIKVLLVIANKLKLSQLLLINVLDYHLSICKSMLSEFNDYLIFFS